MPQQTIQPKQISAGFTLLETMIVMAIAGIVAAIAIPSYLSWRPGYYFRGAVSQVQQDLTRAKARAYEINNQCRVEFCANGTDYQIIDGDQSQNSTWTHANCPMTAAEQAVYAAVTRRVISRNINEYIGTSITPGATFPTFSPRGTASVATVTVNHPNFPSKAITVNITGRVRVP